MHFSLTKRQLLQKMQQFSLANWDRGTFSETEIVRSLVARRIEM